MAVNKTINGSTNNNQWTYKLEVSEIATSIQNNTSTVQVKAYLGRASSQSYLGGGYSVSVTCNGQSQNQSGTINYPTYINGGAWLELKTFTFTVSHNSDGTKTASISSSFSSGDFTPSYASANGSIVLSPLHKPPTLTLSSVSEGSDKLSGIGGTTFVNNISIKTYTLNYTMFDSATASSLKIYDKNDNELSATTSLSSSSGTITVNFKNTPINSNVITNNKTTFTIKFTDSLNGVTTITTPEYTVIPYFAPNLIATASNVKRNGQTTGKAVLNLTGRFYNATIGNTTNAITLSFKYWTGSAEPSTYYTIPSSANTGSGNDITVSSWEFKKNNATVTDLDKSNSYKFKIKAVDSFGSEYESIIELTLAKGEWLMAKFKDRIDFLKISIGGRNVYGEKVLYDDPAGTSGNITLSDDSSNYDYIEIFYYNINYQNIYSSVKVPNPNGKKIELQTIYPNNANSRMYVLGTYYNCSGTSLNYVEGFGLAITSGNIYGVSQDSIKIVKVIGYK